MFEMHGVESSNILKIGYHAETATLRVVFHRDGVATATWDYEGVPPDTFTDFLEAPSKGRHFIKFIKGIFPGKKVEDAT